MSNKNIAILACKISAILMLFNATRFMEFTIWQAFLSSSNFDGLDKAFFIIGSTLPLITSLLLSFLFWTKATPLAAKIVGNMESENKPSLTYESIEILGLSLIGAFILVQAIPGIFETSVYLFMRESINHELVIHDYAKMVKNIVYFLLGVYLVLGSRGLVKLINILRTGGTRKTIDQYE